MFILDRDEEIAQWVALQVHGSIEPVPGTRAVGWEESGEIIAGVAAHTFTPGRNMFVDIALSRGRFPRPLLSFCFHYAFGQLSLPRLTFSVDSANHKSMTLCQRLGAVREATLSCAAREGDLVLFRLCPDAAFVRRIFDERSKDPSEARLRQSDSGAGSLEHEAIRHGSTSEPAEHHHSHRHNYLDPTAWDCQPDRL